MPATRRVGHQKGRAREGSSGRAVPAPLPIGSVLRLSLHGEEPTPGVRALTLQRRRCEAWRPLSLEGVRASYPHPWPPRRRPLCIVAQMSEEEKAAAAAEMERKKAASEGGMGMMPFIVLALAFAIFMYLKKQGA